MNAKAQSTPSANEPFLSILPRTTVNVCVTLPKVTASGGELARITNVLNATHKHRVDQPQRRRAPHFIWTSHMFIYVHGRMSGG